MLHRPQFACLAGLALSLAAPILLIFLGAFLVCPGGACQVPVLDREVLASLHAWRHPWLDLLFQAATWLGSLALLLPLAILLFRQLRRRGEAAAATLFCLSLAGAWLLALAAKALVQRPRPDLYPFLTLTPSDLSFPSAHAMQVAAFALGWLLFARPRWSWKAAAAAGGAVAGIALSRLYLQVHFPTDVAFGLAAAAAWVAGLRLFLLGPLQGILATAAGSRPGAPPVRPSSAREPPPAG